MNERTSQELDVVILAAGKGTRMYSDTPKVLHKVAGKPMLRHVIDCARTLCATRIHVVVGFQAEKIRSVIDDSDIHWSLQEQQLGTGHAVKQALPAIPQNATVLVLYADVPLIAPSTLSTLLESAGDSRLAILSVLSQNPYGLGRIIRNAANQPIAIVEEKDANEQQKLIKETNTGILAAPASQLHGWIDRLKNNNAQGEYYLTDILAMAVSDQVQVSAEVTEDETEVLGVNNRQQLAIVERQFQLQQANDLLLRGVSLADPKRIDIRGKLECGRDVEIDVNAVIEGHVILGDRVRIASNVYLKDAVIGNDVHIHANSHIEDTNIAQECQIGPFARLRPGTRLAKNAKIGNFVETKKANIGIGSKVNHLSYVGDSELGENVNIGAGTITCNYDGVNKFKTIIKDGVFVGSNTALVAPVTLGKGATIGAGSIITADVEEDSLAVARAKQRSISGWKRPVKK
ncbi:MAG: bifunctional UDP-N-acetylglucosamine diphosphorylase/glucosamine-1-phosphate N-acetyltransferase GlmU [Pseudohongiellaceae bacterium]|nr:bifunctional UDP-N-acetylglucosamine diphosphorylase/glucosamine-1-phosphate N-acetyltransferase GlmU [Pseudohongiellaceae bacterium]